MPLVHRPLHTCPLPGPLRPHVPQETLVTRQVIVPIDLQHKLQVQVLPVSSVMDLVRIDRAMSRHLGRGGNVVICTVGSGGGCRNGGRRALVLEGLVPGSQHHGG